jgi:two-component sensor histidine kinase
MTATPTYVCVNQIGAAMDKDDANAAIPPEQGGATAEELAYRLRQQQITAEYGRFALQTHTISVMLQEATRLCALGLQSKFAKAMEYLPHEGQFIIRAGVGWKEGVVGQARAGAHTQSPAGYAFKTGEPVISNHLSSEIRFRTPAILAEHGVKGAINVIIQGNAAPFGVLEVDSPNEGRFTDADLAFMQGFANMLGIAIERQQAEEALQASEARLRANEELLQQALAHQEVLTAEISHRVKNSLGITAGLLRMQARMTENAEVVRALEDAQSRVQTIAQVHNRLWRAHEAQEVNLADFLGDMANQLQASAPPGHTLTCNFVPVGIATDQVVPLGLLMNELVTNAFKYAYPAEGGDVRVEVHTTGPERLQLVVSDQGIGLPPHHDPDHSKSLGMKLIHSLGRQLGGKAEWLDAGPGTRFTLDFPRRDGDERLKASNIGANH